MDHDVAPHHAALSCVVVVQLPFVGLFSLYEVVGCNALSNSSFVQLFCGFVFPSYIVIASLVY